MAGVGIKGDGNGGLHVPKITFGIVLVVANALGWPVGALLLGPDKVAEDAVMKSRMEQLDAELKEHKDESSKRFIEVESRADRSADQINERLRVIESRLDEAIRLLVKDKNG